MRYANLSLGNLSLRDGQVQTLPKGYSSLASDYLTQILPILKNLTMMLRESKTVTDAIMESISPALSKQRFHDVVDLLSSVQ